MNSDNLKYVLRQFVERRLPTCQPRELVIPTGTGKVIGLSGVRRCGKTFIFFETIGRLLAQGVDRRCLIYLNFDDDRLQPVRAAELDLVLRGHRELFPETIGQRLYLFLDEVQSAPGWERWVRRLMDTEDVAVFVTGSSSRVLTRDLATALRGRSLTWEVFPLSFRECLAFRRIAWVPANADSESAVKAAFEQYLLWGGFPEIVLADDAMRPLILAEYASLMFYRDLVERYHVRNEPLMREMLRHAYRHTAGLLSISKLHRDLQSLGLAVSKQTVIDYLAHLADSFLLFLLPKQERSLRKQAHNPKKLHVIDPGLVTAFQVDAGRDLGHRLETAVFLELRRRQPQWYYYANGSEIDLCDGDGASFYNCCWALTSPETVARERQAMALGRARWPRAAGHLLYHEHGLQARAALPEAEPAWRLLATPPQAPSLASASKG